MVRRLPQLALVMLLATSASASAQRRPPKPPAAPQSLPPDLGFGWVGAPEHPLPIYPEGATLAELRDALDPLASQGVLLPSAHVPPRGTLSARNHNLFGQQLGGVPWDDLMLSAMIFTPYAWLTDAPGLDLIAGAQLSWAASRTARGGLTLSAGYLTRSGGAHADSSEAGPLLGLVWERAVAPSLLLGLGALAYTPAWYSLEALDTSQCADREALLAGDCITLTRDVQRWPVAGSWLVPYAQLTWFLSERLIVKAELTTGASRGTMLDLEGPLSGQQSPAQQRARFEAPNLNLGALQGVPLTLQLVAATRLGSVGLQGGLIALLDLSERPTPTLAIGRLIVLPTFTIGYTY